MRLPLVLSFAALLLSGAAAAQGSAARSPGSASCERSRSDDVITSVSGRGELLLASRRTIKLLDVRLPADRELERASARLQSLIGQRVAVAAAAEAADRWNRIAADVALLDEAAGRDIAELLVDEGLALIDAGSRALLCRPALLMREERARARRLGLWASDRYAPIAAEEGPQLHALIGQFALVEGVVRSVGERRERTYLNFGVEWATDMTMTIPKRIWAAMQERGVSAVGLKGRRVRARGVLEEWQGVTMEIAAADMLEVLGQDTTRP
jgi:Staphylococcal nuclease homologue